MYWAYRNRVYCTFQNYIYSCSKTGVGIMLIFENHAERTICYKNVSLRWRLFWSVSSTLTAISRINWCQSARNLSEWLFSLCNLSQIDGSSRFVSIRISIFCLLMVIKIPKCIENFIFCLIKKPLKSISECVPKLLYKKTNNPIFHYILLKKIAKNILFFQLDCWTPWENLQ